MRTVLRVVRCAMRLPSLAVCTLLRVYRLLVSPTYGQVCRFYPSCSEYALVAVDRHGVIRGGWLALRRLVRCHPWNPGGVDLVPQSGPRAVRRCHTAASEPAVSPDVDDDTVPGHRQAA